MPHVTLPDLPGMYALITQFPETGKHISALRTAVMDGPSPLTQAEREIIGTYVSRLNECRFCTNGHAGIARRLLGEQAHIVDMVLTDFESAPINDMMKALLTIAGKVQQGGRRVTDEDVARARGAGADDQAIHDTVLVAALFCMANRYVDGLDTKIQDDAVY